MSKRLLCSHVDLDGWGSVLLHLFFKNRIEDLNFDSFILLDYGWENDSWNIEYLSKFDEVIMTDISAPKEYIDRIRNSGTIVRIFDHHLASDWLRDDEFSVWDKERSGTRIFWEEYVYPRVKRFPPIISDFIELVDVYDCWRQESPKWDEAVGLNNVLYRLKNWKETNEIDSCSKFVNTVLRKFTVYPEGWQWSGTEKDIIKEAQEKEMELYNKAISEMRIRIDNHDRAFGIITLGSKISLVCSRILNDNPAMDYIICINAFRGINGKLSFRTKKEDLDLNEFVGVHGHANASGAEVTPEVATRIWQEDLVPMYSTDFTGENPLDQAIFTKQEKFF